MISRDAGTGPVTISSQSRAFSTIVAVPSNCMFQHNSKVLTWSGQYVNIAARRTVLRNPVGTESQVPIANRRCKQP